MRCHRPLVNIGSISGETGGVAAHSAYGASKAGATARRKSRALEGAKQGVPRNAVARGPLEGALREIAEIVAFRAGPGASRMVGANGGALMP